MSEQPLRPTKLKSPSLKPSELRYPGPVERPTLKPTRAQLYRALQNMELAATEEEAQKYHDQLLESTRPMVPLTPEEESGLGVGDVKLIEEEKDEPKRAINVVPGSIVTERGVAERDPFSRPPSISIEQEKREEGELAFKDEKEFERIREEAAVIADDRPLGPFTPFKPGFVSDKLFDELSVSKPSRAPMTSEFASEGREATRARYRQQTATSREEIEEAGFPAETPTFGGEFKEAFDEARASGAKEFVWSKTGKVYHTRTAEEERVVTAPTTESGERDSFINKVIRIESGGDPTAKTNVKGGTAGGLFGFIDKTWVDLAKKYFPELANKVSKEELIDLKFNPDVARQFFDKLVEENANVLEQEGIPVNDSSLYAAHFLGSSGAAKLYKAKESAPVEKVLGDQVVRFNKFLKGKDIAWLKQWIDRKML